MPSASSMKCVFASFQTPVVKGVGKGLDPVVDNANWISLPSPLKFGMTFPVAAVVGMLLMAIVTTIETVGDISATTIGGANREPSDKELSGGILADGLGTAFASIFNALPNTSYSQNAGLVAFSGVMSRHVVTLSGIILIGFGFSPNSQVGREPKGTTGFAASIKVP